MSGFTLSDLSPLAPFLVLAGGGVLLVVIDAILGKRHGFNWTLPTLLFLLITLLEIVALWKAPTSAGSLSWLIGVDRFALFLSGLIVVSAIATVILSQPYLEKLGQSRGEFYALLLFSASGMVLFTSTTELLTLFLGLELLSIPIYILTGFLRRDLRSGEAAMKYFLLGAFSSAIFLLGIAFFFGATGTTNLLQISRHSPGAMLTTGQLLLLTGFLFKVASVPFHMWAPDAYEGAPTSVTAYMSSAIKAAAFAGLARVFIVGLFPTAAQWDVLWWILAALSMVLGNVVAIAQKSLKRMLAYSSISYGVFCLQKTHTRGEHGD